MRNLHLRAVILITLWQWGVNGTVGEDSSCLLEGAWPGVYRLGRIRRKVGGDNMLTSQIGAAVS